MKFIIGASLFMLMACQPTAQHTSKSNVAFLTAEAPTPITASHNFEIAQNPGANIRFALQWSKHSDKASQDFQTKQACTITSHLDHFKVYLLHANTSLGSIVPISLGTLLNPVEGPFTIGKKTLTSPSGNENFVFSNVPEGKYYIAMSAHNIADVNITKVSLSSPTGLLSGSLVAVSNGGGNPSSPGRVEVGAAPTYTILNGTESTLTLSLELSSLLCL